MHFVFFGFLAAATALGSVQTSTPAAQSAGAVSRATAVELAEAIAPANVMIPLEVEQARQAVLAIPTLDEDANELEREYPGLYRAVWIAVEPEIIRSAKADHPVFLKKLEQLYVARLSEAEAMAMLTFYKTATGQKLLRGLYGSFDPTPMLAGVLKSGGGAVSAKDMQAATEAAKAKAVGQVGPGDHAALMALAASIDLPKFQALGAETQKVTLEWVNTDDPKTEAELARTMEIAMEQHMAAHPLKK